jgi:hypothetical protein
MSDYLNPGNLVNPVKHETRFGRYKVTSANLRKHSTIKTKWINSASHCDLGPSSRTLLSPTAQNLFEHNSSHSFLLRESTTDFRVRVKQEQIAQRVLDQLCESPHHSNSHLLLYKEPKPIQDLFIGSAPGLKLSGFP